MGTALSFSSSMGTPMDRQRAPTEPTEANGDRPFVFQCADGDRPFIFEIAKHRERSDPFGNTMRSLGCISDHPRTAKRGVEKKKGLTPFPMLGLTPFPMLKRGKVCPLLRDELRKGKVWPLLGKGKALAEKERSDPFRGKERHAPSTDDAACRRFSRRTGTLLAPLVFRGKHGK